jgi:hypothetical protein
MNNSGRYFTPIMAIELLRELLNTSENQDTVPDPTAGSSGFSLSALKTSKEFDDDSKEFGDDSPALSFTLSTLGRDTLDKLDGVWSVQLFFRTWPYYARRANSIGVDPFRDSTIVLLEQLPLPSMTPETQDKWQLFLKQLWAMPIVYIEAILEHYFLGLIEGEALWHTFTHFTVMVTL